MNLHDTPGLAEADRLAALQAYDIMDTAPEAAFDDLVQLAAAICKVPIALISLIDDQRQWFKANQGLAVAETSRDIAFCSAAIEQNDLFVVPDALQDTRFADNPLVLAEPSIRFYAGAPLITPEGHALGTLCVIDREPRQLSAEQENALRVLSRHAMTQLELRRRVAELARSNAARDAAIAAMQQARQQLDRQVIAQAARIERLNRVHAVLTASNAVTAQITDRQQLLEACCRIAVDTGRLRMAWVALLDADGNGTPAAWHGVDDDYMGTVQVSVRHDGPHAERPTNRALRCAEAVVCNDIAADPGMALSKAAAVARGCRSLMALPLTVADRPIGVLALYASEPGFFDHDEQKLLLDLASDMSLALGDIAKRERLDYLAHYSVPTGLANRTLFERRLGDEIAAARSSDTACSALVVDVDRFRLLNDTLGRDAGDHLLGMIAQRLTSAFGDASRVAHLGADSFAIISTGSDAQARSTQAAVLAALARPFMLGTHEQWISVKTAQAMFPADADDAGMLLANAEAALKRARSRGDRHADYRAELNPRVSGNLDLENRLRRAIETRQFVLHYQPKVDLANGRIAGLEALIRWNDPQRGLVPPARFIPLLEETGLIIEVGGWVLEQAAADHRRWHALGLAPPRVAVNVSPLQLSQKGFVADVDRAARVAALDIEITEGVFLDDMARSTQTLHAIREIGVKVAIDDFGTGYSSLSYLARLPVDALKIDRSFIVGLTRSANDMAIVSSVISLAHGLRLAVIAEGVEHEDQRRLLQLLRCDQMQGYLYSPAVDSAAIETLLTAQSLQATSAV